MKHKTLKTFVGLWAFFPAFYLSAGTYSFSEACQIIDDNPRYTLKSESNKKFLGNIEAIPNARFPQMKLSQANGCLNIDTRDFEVTGKENVVMRMHLGEQNEFCRENDLKSAGKINRVSIEIKSDAPILMNYGLEGERKVDGKSRHWFNMKKVVLNDKWQTITMELMLPADISRAWSRFDFPNTVNVQIRKITFGAVPKK